MTTSIEQALQPLFLTASIVGLGVHSPKKFYLTILYNLSIWIVYFFLYYYIVIVWKVEKFFFKLSGIVRLQIGALNTILSIIISLYQAKRFQILLKRLAAVDDTLMKLGTPRTYGKLRAFSKWVLIAWFVYSFTMNTNDIIWWLHVIADYGVVLIPYVTNHYLHVNMLVDLIFLTLVWYIGTQFDEIYKHMEHLLIKQEHELRCTWRILNRQCIMHPNNYKRVLWTSMHLHLELCQIARDLNSLLGIQMTIEMAAFLIYVTVFCYFLFICFQKKFAITIIKWFNICLWIFIYMIRLFCINYICESVCAKANKLDRILHQLTDILRYADLRTEIYQFVLQIMHRPLKFTGLGLFYFGNVFLWKFFVTVTTFVILMIQMPTLPTAFKREEKF